MKKIILTTTILFSLTYAKESTLIELNNSNYLSIINNNKPVLVKYWASWCQPCQILAPKFKAIAKEYKGKIVFAELNVDKYTNIATKNYITRLPTIVLYYKGKEVDRFTGIADKKYLREWANNILDYFRKNK